MRGFVPTAVATALLLAGCGTRLNETELRAAGSAQVRIAPESVEAIAAAVVRQTGTERLATVENTPRRVSTPARQAAASARGFAMRPTAKPRPADDPPAPSAVPVPRACSGAEAPVVLGQVGNFGGIVGPIVAASRTTMAAWVKDVNARGGLACHPVVLYQRDDGGDQSRSAAAVAELVGAKKAVAIVGAMPILTMAGFTAGVERMRIPVVGGDGLTGEWDRSRYLYRQGAGLDGQVAALLAHLRAEGRPKFAHLYCIETPSCTAAVKVVDAQARRVGAELVYRVQVSATQTEYSAPCLNARSSGAQVLLLALDGASIGRVARSCATVGYRPLLASTGGVIGIEQARDPQLRASGFAATSLTAPWMLRTSPGQRDLHDAMARHAPGVEIDSNAVSAWASGRLLEAAVAGLGPAARAPLTSQSILRGLATVRNETLGGLAPPLTFHADRTRETTPRCVFLEVLTTRGWTAPRGNRTLCT
ncbi:MAG: ABC transporter substrate-binding protein [Sporichthyaceae bacterium]